MVYQPSGKVKRRAVTSSKKPIYVAGKVNPIGHVESDTFLKSIKTRHMLRQPPAIALDVQSLRDAEEAGAAFVEITNTETRKQYRASVAAIWRHGFRFDRGWGEQIALTLNQWVDPARASRTARLDSSDTAQRAPSHQQLGLFGRVIP